MTSARSLLDFISSSQHLGNELKLLYKDPFPRPHSVLIHHSRQYVLRASFAFYPSSNWHKTYSVLWKSVSAALIYISHKHKDKRKANNCDRGMMYDGSEDSFYPGPVSPSQITWTDPEAAHNIRTAFYRVLSLYTLPRKLESKIFYVQKSVIHQKKRIEKCSQKIGLKKSTYGAPGELFHF